MDAPPLPPPPGQLPEATPWGPPPALPLRYASFWIRMAAYLIDVLVLIPLSLPLAVAAWTRLSDQMDRFMRTNQPVEIETIFRQYLGWALLIAAGTYAYQVLMVRYFGGSLGKLAVGIRVRVADGSVCGWRESLLRPILQLIVGFGSFVPGAGIITLVDDLWMVWDHQSQTLHDKVANTIVISV
jgi:uncharacterized RDD family membrane protein YckC